MKTASPFTIVHTECQQQLLKIHLLLSACYYILKSAKSYDKLKAFYQYTSFSMTMQVIVEQDRIRVGLNPQPLTAGAKKHHKQIPKQRSFILSW